jgi:hypothetical protein
MSDVALADLDAAITGTETIVAGIAPGQRGAPTPCPGLDGAPAINRLAGFLGRAVLSARRIPGGRSVA